MVDYAIQFLEPHDWEQVRTIYLEGIATRNATFETEPPSWAKWNSSHLPFGRLVARRHDAVLGWAALSPVSGRTCYAGVAEVSVYVRRCDAGRGIGKALLQALIEISERSGVWTLQAGIFPENAASLALVRSCGFREVGRRERIGRLDGHWRDVLLLERGARQSAVLRTPDAALALIPKSPGRLPAIRTRTATRSHASRLLLDRSFGMGLEQPLAVALLLPDVHEPSWMARNLALVIDHRSAAPGDNAGIPVHLNVNLVVLE